jgi:hypothetical protein
MPKFIYNARGYLNACVYLGEIDEVSQKPKFAKYHTIKDNAHKKGKFAAFIKGKFPKAQYINFYDKTTGNFMERLYLE